jgi:hypothetical protein
VRAKRDRDDGSSHAHDPGVDLDLLVAAEGLCHHERDEHDRREQLDEGLHARRQGAPPDRDRPCCLERDRRDADDRYDDPGVAQRRIPRRQAAEAAMIGTPAGVKGVSTSVMTAASAAA